ncbi:hypothetical protein A3O11_05510 [Ligilactobacillus aviarius]|uniref:hypothetical protein n=1 Tax=Ligilactobacillus aviarius TaxID=1606 RepID=UPI0007DA31F0|nr:hypothetical protein [Ligilactobacillus aviarius]OAQ01716.1 hypothetical protein A3O10_02575 [Ligilactobacillus aviarius]OAQ04283.1 hypothetical protein A3O11_05510 [Ligilactobacillus aviarius]OAS81115.1 hypothetical protein A3O18_00165 [Ligilactobacillus aviarius]PEG71434.1 hypothetical protein A3P04_01015 [Ligilactobacillus aviarius]PEG74344.1 hypothetical protein A3O82_01370 [Ligilactobacillus aviarius]
MYYIINPINSTVCSKWNYMNDTTEHFCWKTAEEIRNNNSYRNDTTEAIRFSTKGKAENFIKTVLGNQKGLEIITTSYIQHLIDLIGNRIEQLFNHKNNKHHMTLYY